MKTLLRIDSSIKGGAGNLSALTAARLQTDLRAVPVEPPRLRLYQALNDACSETR